jgi:hypothetical protein
VSRYQHRPSLTRDTNGKPHRGRFRRAGTLNLPILAASGLLLSIGALVAHHSRHDRPGLRLVLLVVSALSAWAVPSLLVTNVALVDFALTEPGELCHDVPCREGVALIGVSWSPRWPPSPTHCCPPPGRCGCAGDCRPVGYFGFRLDHADEVRGLRGVLEADEVTIIEYYDEPTLCSMKCLDPDGHRVEAYREQN